MTVSLSDPPEPRVLLAAAQWLEGTLLGSLATTIAIIAVALVGFAMLQGRLELRRGISVLLGCFLLFGAASIAQGLRGLSEVQTVAHIPSAPPPPIRPPQHLPTTTPYDPYAGAAVPTR